MSDEGTSDEEDKIIVPMTQEECENWIMLKGQSGERWFRVEILDEEIAKDPTMQALMEAVSDMIFRGIQGMPFAESEYQRAQDAQEAENRASPKLEIVE